MNSHKKQRSDATCSEIIGDSRLSLPSQKLTVMEDKGTDYLKSQQGRKDIRKAGMDILISGKIKNMANELSNAPLEGSKSKAMVLAVASLYVDSGERIDIIRMGELLKLYFKSKDIQMPVAAISEAFFWLEDNGFVSKGKWASDGSISRNLVIRDAKQMAVRAIPSKDQRKKAISKTRAAGIKSLSLVGWITKAILYLPLLYLTDQKKDAPFSVYDKPLFRLPNSRRDG